MMMSWCKPCWRMCVTESVESLERACWRCCKRLTLVRGLAQPLNLGSTEMVSMNEMMEMALGFEGKKLPIKHIPVRFPCCIVRNMWILLPMLEMHTRWGSLLGKALQTIYVAR